MEEPIFAGKRLGLDGLVERNVSEFEVKQQKSSTTIKGGCTDTDWEVGMHGNLITN